DVHTKVVLAGVAVQLIGSLRRLTLCGLVSMKLLDVPVVDDRGRVAPQRIGSAVHLSRQRLLVLAGVGDRLDLRLTRVVRAEAVVDADKTRPILGGGRVRETENTTRCRNHHAHASSSAPRRAAKP